MSALDRLKEALKGVAPTLAASLVPGGPLVVAAVKTIGEAVLGKPHATPDELVPAVQAMPPDVVARLQESDNALRATLAKIDLRREEIHLQDAQHQHRTTQDTIRESDKAEDPFVRRTRPAQSWVSLFAAFAYVFSTPNPDVTILGLLLALPWAYAGLREVGKGVKEVTEMKKVKARSWS